MIIDKVIARGLQTPLHLKKLLQFDNLNNWDLSNPFWNNQDYLSNPHYRFLQLYLIKNTDWNSMISNKEKLQKKDQEENDKIALGIADIGTKIGEFGADFASNYLNNKLNLLQHPINNPGEATLGSANFSEAPEGTKTVGFGNHSYSVNPELTTNTTSNVTSPPSTSPKQTGITGWFNNTTNSNFLSGIKNTNIKIGNENATAGKIGSGVSTALGVALSLGATTGSKAGDAAVTTGVGTATNVLSNGGANPYALAANIGSSILGASSNNKYAQAGSLALGALGTYLGGGNPYGALIGAADTLAFGDNKNIHREYAGKKGGIAKGLDMSYDAIQAGSAAIPVYGPLISAMMAANKFDNHLMKSLGGNTDGMTTIDALLGSTWTGGLGSVLAGNPLAIAGAINGFAGKTTSSFAKDQDIYDNIGGSYAGSNALADEVEPYAGKKFGVFSSGSRKKWEKKIVDMIGLQNRMSQINDESQRSLALQQTMSSINNIANENKLSGGYNNYTTFAKNGTILEKLFGDKSLGKARRIVIKTSKTIIIEPTEESKIVEEVKQPTKIQMSVIPEGALHARLHHMEDDENITKKGIPVVDNDGEQQAEIECNEIIFCLDATKKLEEYWHDGTDDAALNAGKLLVKEILEHTIDRTGLIDTLKKGGEILLAQQGANTDDLFEIPSTNEMLEDWINRKIQERTEAAIKKATTRELPYMFKNPNWANCIATATDNYGVPICLRNRDFMNDPEKWGFEEIQFGDNTDSLPDGVLILDFNKPKDSTTPGHTIMLVGRTEKGAPIYSYSSGHSRKSDMHNQTTNYYFARWDLNIKPKAYRYKGTPEERKKWEEEFYNEYPQLVGTLEEIPLHKQGGSVNIIPEGALHARKNNMEGAGEDFTHKGIPVIDNQGEQLAEIECNEIIFRLEVTKQLEKLSKEDDKDKAALEAGKLLVDEILNNTDDRTGLIQNV